MYDVGARYLMTKYATLLIYHRELVEPDRITNIL